jgi:hypothetical protein
MFAFVGNLVQLKQGNLTKNGKDVSPIDWLWNGGNPSRPLSVQGSDFPSVQPIYHLKQHDTDCEAQTPDLKIETQKRTPNCWSCPF